MFIVGGVLAGFSFMSQPSTTRVETAARSASADFTVRSKTDEAELASASRDLIAIQLYVGSPLLRKEITGLREGADAGTICRFSKDWFNGQSANIAMLWAYVKSRRSTWPATLRDEIFARAQLTMQERFGPSYQPSEEEMLQFIDAGTKEVPQKLGACGPIVRAYIAWKNDKVAEYQNLAATIFSETARQLAYDVNSTDDDARRHALEVIRRLNAALQAARQLSIKNP